MNDGIYKLFDCIISYPINDEETCLMIDEVLNLILFRNHGNTVYIDLKTGKTREITDLELVMCNFKTCENSSIFKQWFKDNALLMVMNSI